MSAMGKPLTAVITSEEKKSVSPMESLRMKARRVPEDVKEEAVRRVVEDGDSPSAVAKEATVSESSVHGWVRKYRDMQYKDNEIEELKSTVATLKERLSRLERQRDILISQLES